MISALGGAEAGRSKFKAIPSYTVGYKTLSQKKKKKKQNNSPISNVPLKFSCPESQDRIPPYHLFTVLPQSCSSCSSIPPWVLDGAVWKTRHISAFVAISSHTFSTRKVSSKSPVGSCFSSLPTFLLLCVASFYFLLNLFCA